MLRCRKTTPPKGERPMMRCDLCEEQRERFTTIVVQSAAVPIEAEMDLCKDCTAIMFHQEPIDGSGEGVDS